MTINSVLQSGVQGVQKGIQGMEQSAKEVVAAGSVDSAAGTSDIVEPIIELKLYERSVEASAKVVKTADELLGKLLDTMA